MSVDFDAIARAGRCDVSSLRLALPLLEQGYTPPFLARYRRDELSGVDEASLWLLSNALKTERQLADRREELRSAWEQTPLRDPALGAAITKANSLRVLTRLARSLKVETNATIDDATRLAVRVLNPRKGDGGDVADLATKVEGIEDAAALEGLDQAIARRLMGDPRIIAAATRWLARNAKIYIQSISDPHAEAGTPKAKQKTQPTADKATGGEPQAATTPTATGNPEAASADGDLAAVADPAATDASSTAGAVTIATDLPGSEPSGSEPPVASVTSEPTGDEPAGDTEPTAAGAAKPATKPQSPAVVKQAKKVSPRQRRRRWLVSVLKPIAGKRFKADKLSAFQIVMLGRALRSQVANCSFEYDAAKLVAELQRTAQGINHAIADQLAALVLEHEADIREAAESAWWDDLAERASARLVNVTANHLQQQINRGAVDAKIVLSIDAVGPRTAAATIVAADGRLLHSEDIPCQLSTAQRTLAVNKMGELIHHHHVDLIVISNGPARRATMIALSELIKQSPEKSIRWTLADRSGADIYSGSAIADQEMRSTPRRFRAAAWLAFSVLQPAHAITKVDPLKLRLSSFQRELADDAILDAIEDVLTSGASRGGVDVNAAPVTALVRLPGMTVAIAKAIDTARRQTLFPSRAAIADLEQWETVVQSRQAIPFLRVFLSEQPLDGTLVHPDDYALAQKLAKSLQIELPPPAPPGYQPPQFESEAETGQTVAVGLSESERKSVPIEVKDFSSAGENAPEFQLATDAPAAGAAETADPADGSAQASNPEASNPEASNPEAEVAAHAETDSEPEQTAPADSETATVASASAPSGEEDHFKRPLPERAKIDKCVKEWQIGKNRATQIVHWLCDPFGDSDASGTPPAVMSSVPTTAALKPGDQVIGVVVSVMPFGVFVELAPDCSGLIHVSRVSESFVEDLHEAVQVGDVVSTWVIGIDDKRRRVALSAISPARAAELEQQRHAAHDRSPRAAGGPPRGRSRGPDRSGTTGTSTGNRAPAANAGKRTAEGNQNARPPRGRAPGKASGQPADRGQQTNRSRDGGRGRRDHDRGARGRDRKPESYRVVSKQEVKPLTDEMQKGKEPLRSFGDLAQFFSKEKPVSAVPAETAPPTPPAAASPPVTAGPNVATSETVASGEKPTAESAAQRSTPATASDAAAPSSASNPPDSAATDATNR
jgi:transcriptional accessory protein Tex/SPT6